MGYLFLIPVAIDCAKFLCRFTIELTDKDIAEEFFNLANKDLHEKNQFIDSAGDFEPQAQKTNAFGGLIEEFCPSETAIDELCDEAIKELAIFLKARKITQQDLESIWPDLIIKLSIDLDFAKALFAKLWAHFQKQPSSLETENQLAD